MATAKLIEQLIDTNEVAARFGVNYTFVLDAIKRKKLATIQPAGRQGKHFIYIPEAERWAKTIKNRPTRKLQVPPELFTVDNSRNIEIANTAADLMIQANKLIATAQQLLEEIN
jgi:hypothetical protein